METISNILNAISSGLDNLFVIISIIIAIFTIYFKIKSNLSECITTFITMAAKRTDLTGPEKMELVISWLKDIIPRLFRVLFSKEVLNQMAQNIYDDMEEYRDNYNKAKGIKTTEEE